MLAQDCNVWLLTEVMEWIELPGFHRHLGAAPMYRRKILPWRGAGARPHQIEGSLSIDHIAVGRNLAVRGARRFSANGSSDHDGYVVDVEKLTSAS